MPAENSASKAILTISTCSVNSGQISVDPSKQKFEALINPSGYEHSYGLEYSKKGGLGRPGAEAKYSGSKPEKVILKEMILDGTGIVRPPNSPKKDEPPKSVKDQITLLKKVVYTYEGDKHETLPVQLKWGSFLFYGRVESLKFDYTLFKPNGVPLRAKITLTFVCYESSEEISKEAKQQSPDLTHCVEVKAGDTLPLLCYQIYQDCSYYIKVAQENNLDNFRNLKPGRKLYFPPSAKLRPLS